MNGLLPLDRYLSHYALRFVSQYAQLPATQQCDFRCSCPTREAINHCNDAKRKLNVRSLGAT